jgi:hypothetical protein
MGETPAKLHCHQRDDLHRFTGAGWLLDKHGTAGAAHIGDEAGLIGAESFADCGVQGCTSEQVKL